MLDILGHVYEVQPPLLGALGTTDYAFFTAGEARQPAAPMLGKAGYWETVLAVGDAKRWERPLDERIVNGAPDASTNANPCYQIDYYLRRTGCAPDCSLFIEFPTNTYPPTSGAPPATARNSRTGAGSPVPPPPPG